MGEAIAVDGSGSPPSAQIIFSAIDEEKEGDCALPPEEGEGLQDAAAGRPGALVRKESELVTLLPVVPARSPHRGGLDGGGSTSWTSVQMSWAEISGQRLWS